jgi:ankyrin repeat protein
MPIFERVMFKTGLSRRVEEGDETAVDAMTEEGLDIKRMFGYLVTACEYGHLNIVERLLAIDGVTEVAANEDNYALHVAATRGHLNVVERLLQIDAVRENAAADNNKTINSASYNGHLNVVERLLQIDAVRENLRDLTNFGLAVSLQNGHLNVVNRLLQIDAVREIAIVGFYSNLVYSAYTGNLNYVERLLQIDGIIDYVANDNNYVLRSAAENGHLNVVERLLQVDKIRDAAAANNNVLIYAVRNGHLNVVNRLLQIDAIRENASANNNIALRSAAQNRHSEISYILARLKWPNGIKDIPQNLRWCIPAIRQGAMIVKTKEESLKEATQIFRWLQEGYIPTSRKDLYLPPMLSSKKLQETITTPFPIMNLINEYAGTKRDVDTSRPTTEELTMISVRGLNLLRESSSIMNRLEKARTEREEREHSCNNLAIVPYNRPGFN